MIDLGRSRTLACAGLLAAVALAAVALAACGAARAPDESLAAPAPPSSGSSSPLAPSASAAPEPAAYQVKPDDLVVLVVDRSGSMTGVPIEMAREALRRAPKACPGCTIELVLFDSTPTHAATYLPGAKQKYDAVVEKFEPGGGTDAVPALRAATKLLEKHGRGGHVVFFTDGQFPVQELDAALAELRAASGTLSAIGLGGVHRPTLVRMARKGQGRLRIVRGPEDLPRAFQDELSGKAPTYAP